MLKMLSMNKWRIPNELLIGRERGKGKTCKVTAPTRMTMEGSMNLIEPRLEIKIVHMLLGLASSRYLPNTPPQDGCLTFQCKSPALNSCCVLLKIGTVYDTKITTELN